MLDTFGTTPNDEIGDGRMGLHAVLRRYSPTGVPGLRGNRVHALEFDVVLLLSCVPFELVRHRLAARRPYLPAAVGTIGLEVHACHLVCNSW